MPNRTSDDDDDFEIDLTVDVSDIDEDEDHSSSMEAASNFEMMFDTARDLRATAAASEEEATSVEDQIMHTPAKSADDLVIKMRLLCRYLGLTDETASEVEGLSRTEFYAWSCLQDLITLVGAAT